MTTMRSERIAPFVITLDQGSVDRANPYRLRVVNEETWDVEFSEEMAGAIAANSMFDILVSNYHQHAQTWQQNAKTREREEIRLANKELEVDPRFGRF